MDILTLKEHNNLIKYKSDIMSQLISSTDLASLCKNDITITEEQIEELIWNNYIPMLFVDGTITNTEAYIMFDIDTRSDRITTFDDITLYFQIYCHKDIIKAYKRQCTRIDAIISELMNLFDEKTTLGIGYNIRIADEILNTTNPNYVGRQLTFKVSDFAERSKIRGKKKNQY